MKVFLAGVSCVGKTAIGTSLAARLGCPFLDLDREIEKPEMGTEPEMGTGYFSEDALEK
jgi:shikimate kinase